MSVFKRRGFAAHREESKRREAVQEAKRGKLFDFYLKDDDDPDAPIRFLTEEPITWYRHRIKDGNQFVNYSCTADKNGDGCDHCDGGDKAQYVGSWLVVDGREFMTDERKNGQKTGKKVAVKDRLKVFTRGSTDIAKLDNKSQKYGLTSRPWFVTKTGSGQSTSYELDRGEEDELTPTQIKKLIEQLPEKYRDMYDPKDSEETLYAILEAQIFGLETEEAEADEPKKSSKKSVSKTPAKSGKSSRKPADDDDDDSEVDDGVQSLDDEDGPEETPKKKLGIKKPGAKTPAKPAPSKPAGKTSIKKPASKPLSRR